MNTIAPKAFISHATEDKDGFVREFAAGLRAKGVDAWLDEWEIAAGDSLVRKIFAQGIAGATVFVVVLSKVSVTKPWVLEELDASVIRKIQEGAKLIPVVLDDVEVPASLRHLLWLSVPQLGMQGVVDETVRSVFGQDNKPPLGAMPGFATQPKRLLANAMDDAVLHAIIEISLSKGQVSVSPEELLVRLQSFGMSKEMIEESVDTLVDDRVIEVERSFASFWVAKVISRTWLDVARSRDVDVDTSYKHLLTKIVNEATLDGFDEVDKLTRDALVERMESDGLITVFRTLGGAHVDVTTKGRRLSREF